MANFRDLGGLCLAAGGVTRPGVLYRSDAPYPGDVVPDDAPVWPPATVIDLRSPGEAGSRYQWPAGVTMHEMPLMRRAALVTGPPEAARERPVSLSSVYLSMLRTVPRDLASIVGIAAHSEGPVLVHCAAGKDRTGVAVAVLLLLGGVEAESVVTDYTATASNVSSLLDRLRGLGRRLPVDVDVHSELAGAPAAAIAVVVEGLTGWPGGPEGWLAEHGGSADDLRRWRDRLSWPTHRISGSSHEG
jgi:protein-tyrosine phosphatase